MPSPVTIVGAGAAGLTAATLLARTGFDVEVIDRRKDVLAASEHSFNLTLNGASRALLRYMGIPIEGIGQTVCGRNIIEQDGRAHRFLYGHRASDTLYSVPRQGLLEGLHDAAVDAGIHIRAGTQLVTINPETGAALLEIGPRTYEDVQRAQWIGSDGVFSICRVHVGHARGTSTSRLDSGTSYIALTIPPDKVRDAGLDPSFIQFASSPGATTIGLPNAMGSISLIVEWSGAEDTRVVESREQGDALLARFKNRRLLDLVPDIEESIVGRRIGRFSYVTSASWWSGKTVLVGDAAHALPPYLGTGANSAMADAVVLAHCMGSELSFRSAVQSYAAERQRFFDALDTLARAHERAIRSGHWGGPVWRARQRLDAVEERLFGTRTPYQRMVFDMPQECVNRVLAQQAKSSA